MRVIDGVHSNTTDTRPAVTLGLVLVESTTSLQEGFLDTSTTGNNTDHGTAAIRDRAFLTRGKLNLGSTSGVSNDGAVLSRGTSKSAAVSNLLLNRADNGTLGHVTNGKNVANVKLGLLTDVDELTSVHAFGAQEKLLIEAVTVWGAESNFSNGGSTTRIMNDVLHDSTEIAMALRVVERTERNLTHTVGGVRLENTSSSLTLS